MFVWLRVLGIAASLVVVSTHQLKDSPVSHLNLPTSIGIEELLSWAGPDAIGSSFVLLHSEAHQGTPSTCRELFQAQLLAATLHKGSPQVKVGSLALNREREEQLPRRLRVSFDTLPAWITMVRHENAAEPFASAYKMGASLHDAMSFWMRVIKDLQPASLNTMLLGISAAQALATSKKQTALLSFVNSSDCSTFNDIADMTAVANAFAGELHTIVALVDVAVGGSGQPRLGKETIAIPSTHLMQNGVNETALISSVPEGSTRSESMLRALNQVRANSVRHACSLLANCWRLCRSRTLTGRWTALFQT